MTDSVAFDDGAVAVIGMAVRVPGAPDLERFWQNLVHGRESVVALDEQQLLARGVRPERLADPDYVRVGAPVEDLEDFDAALFGLTPRDAAATDPQIRLFLEIAHATLENAGYDPVTTDQAIGVMASVGPSRYATLHLDEDAELAGGAGLGLHTLNNSDYAATTTSYRLDLRGPAVTVLTACSSSLVALHLACQSLRAGDCDAIVVGAADVEFPVGHGYLWTPGSILSRTGHCRPFDAEADGTVFGSGAAAVLLKPLAEARHDGDRISAVILGSAVNNDGADKVSFGAPSFVGQASVVMEAMTLAGTDPAEVGYVEMHGTGTPLGDPVEVAALTEAYATLADNPLPAGSCGIGSVKGNVGHLGPAAGMVGLVKAVLALEREQLPPTINLDVVNPRLDLIAGPFEPVRELRAWPATPARTRRAAVSSLGIGGSNAHVVLAETPEPDLPFEPPGPDLVVWSARTEAARDQAAARLADWFTVTGDLHVADGAATTRHGRTAHPVRGAAVVAGARDAAQALRDPDRVVTAGVPTLVSVPGPSAAADASLRALVRRVPALAEALEVVLAHHHDATVAAVRAWGEGAPATPAAAFAAREALEQTWLGLGVPAENVTVQPTEPTEPTEPAGAPALAPAGADPVLAEHLTALALAWVAGVDVDWAAAGCPPPRRREPVPGYPYQRVRHWTPPSAGRSASPVAAPESAPTGSGAWTPVWEDAGSAPAPAAQPGPVLVLAGPDPAAGRQVALAVRQLGLDAVAAGDTPKVVLDARGFGDAAATAPIDTADLPAPTVVLTSAAADVSGCDAVLPERAEAARAALTGPDARWLDAPADTSAERLATGLRLLLASPPGSVVAVRGTRRWRAAVRPLAPYDPVDPAVALDRRAGSVLIVDADGRTALDVAEALATAGVSASVRVVTEPDPDRAEAFAEIEDAGPVVDVVDWDGTTARLGAAVATAVDRARLAAVVIVTTSPEVDTVLAGLAPALADHDAATVVLLRHTGEVPLAVAVGAAAAVERWPDDRCVTVLADSLAGDRVLGLLTGATAAVVVVPE